MQQEAGRKQRNKDKDQRQKMPHKAIKRLKQQFIVYSLNFYSVVPSTRYRLCTLCFDVVGLICTCAPHVLAYTRIGSIVSVSDFHFIFYYVFKHLFDIFQKKHSSACHVYNKVNPLRCKNTTTLLRSKHINNLLHQSCIVWRYIDTINVWVLFVLFKDLKAFW